jgi:hypothetical protein
MAVDLRCIFATAMGSDLYLDYHMLIARAHLIGHDTNRYIQTDATTEVLKASQVTIQVRPTFVAPTVTTTLA